MSSIRFFQGITASLILTVVCLHVHGDRVLGNPPRAMAFPSVMPQNVVWAWEEPENLQSAPPDSVGVAFLAETIFVRGAGANTDGRLLTVLPRRQPLAVAPGAPLMAVVRLIALPGFRDSGELRTQTAAALTEVARRRGLRALQIDFDATLSQRMFYAGVLRQLRAQMPSGMPLSITALVSWCASSPGSGDWLSSLPIDEAVPMFFRLGGSARAGGDKSGYAIREPLCRTSVGISTDESWPTLNSRERVYLFAPHPWTPLKLAALGSILHGDRPLALQYSYAAADFYPPDDAGLPPSLMPPAPAESPSEEKLP